MKRCEWAKNELAIKYHDEEWGVPLHDDRGLFEFLILEGAQAGLSWDTILRKRDDYRKAFDGFEVHHVAQYEKRKTSELMQNGGIIRNRLKIASAVTNARAFLKVMDEFGSFDAYVWGFVKNTTVVGNWKTQDQVPPTSRISDALAKDLHRRGFKFVGSTIMYSFMQATGMVNDHLVSCFRHKECQL